MDVIEASSAGEIADHYPVCASNGLIMDERYEDFDLQSERLSGCDQTYFQLSPGAYEGRFMSVSLGPGLSFHFEYANQRLQQFVGFPANFISLGLVFSEGEPFRVNGMAFSRADVMVCRAGGELNMLSPANGAVMAICIERELVEAHPSFHTLRPLFDSNHGSISVYRAPNLADRLREDTDLAICAARNVDPHADPHALHTIESATLNCILGQLGLNLPSWSQIDHQKPVASGYEACRIAHETMLRMPELPLDYTLLSSQTGLGRRSLQVAFSNNLQMSPGQYSRTLRLNLARRQLRAGLSSHQTIGDVADNYAFHGWSRFTEYYAQLFAERPSQTRK